MELYGYEFIRESDIAHYGLKGMRWGTRRWQNADGTFNAAGKARYFGSGAGENYKKIGAGGSSKRTTGSKNKESLKEQKSGISEETKKKLKTAAKVGAAVAGAALVAYGGYKLNELAKNKLADEYLHEGMERLRQAENMKDWSIRDTARMREHLDSGNIKMAQLYQRDVVKDKLMEQERSLSAQKYLDYARAGKFSTREKADALRRMAKRR